jgi:preprotein translocase subunit SecF
MKKTILTFGLISGAVSSVMMAVTVPFHDRIGFEKGGYILGYTTIVLSMLLVFFGVRSYRDNVSGGQITFAKAFLVGLAITVISCLCYVAAWEVVYFNFMHDFTDKYAAHVIQKAKDAGASAAAIQAKVQEMQRFKQLYENPLFNAAMTFIEPFPVGLVVSLISAAVLRKKRAPGQMAQAVVA